MGAYSSSASVADQTGLREQEPHSENDQRYSPLFAPLHHQRLGSATVNTQEHEVQVVE